jgi:hypothetical protein
LYLKEYLGNNQHFELVGIVIPGLDGREKLVVGKSSFLFATFLIGFFCMIFVKSDLDLPGAS